MKVSDGCDIQNPRLVDEDTWLWCYGPGWSEERVAARRGWDRSGKWLIFLDENSVVEAWNTIVHATKNGELGFRAKVSTAKPTRFSFSDYVIGVYNEDADDAEDVKRIREKLRELGFGVADKLFYKREATTQAGIYHGDDERASSLVL